MQLELYDGVLIPPEGKFPAMTGVIVYKKDDTIGIRLTGESEGMGDHSGNVDGIDYFECSVNSGILTTEDKVDHRELTFAEEGLIRSLLQPKPAYSNFNSTSIPISGLSPAALVRMMQLNQRMGLATPTAGRNKLPPSTSTGTNTPDPAPPTPQLQDPPTRSRSNASAASANASASAFSVASTSSSFPQEPALEEEKPAEKKLTRLEILRQKKEAIRKRKLALQERVEEAKKEKKEQEEKQHQQQEQEKEGSAEATTAATKPLQPMETQDFKSPVPSTVTPVVTQDAAIEDEVASIKSKTSKGSSGSTLSKASRCSRDSIEKLWISELRHESPDTADQYDLEDAENLLLDEDEHEMNDISRIPSTNSMQMQQILRQPHVKDGHLVHSFKSEEQEDLDNHSQEPELVDNGRPQPFRQSSLSRLQQLRQKKRLLEALPASIQTPMAPSAIAANVVLEDVFPLSLNTLAMVTQQSNSLANMAMASAAVLGHPTNENLASFPIQSRDRVQDPTTDATEDTDDNDTLSSQLSDDIMEDDVGEVHDAVPAAFQESVTITPSSTNPLPAFSEESTTTVEPSNALKRRRMLGLGFLPGIKRHQKRQNIGQGQEQQ